MQILLCFFYEAFYKPLRTVGEFLDIKHWKEIKNPEKYAGKELFIGSITDLYNPQKEQFECTKALLEQLRGIATKLSIATKLDLILRDLALIKTFLNACVSWSVNTLEENFQKDVDKAFSCGFCKFRLAGNLLCKFGNGACFAVICGCYFEVLDVGSMFQTRTVCKLFLGGVTI